MVTDLAFEVMDGPFVWGRSDCCTAACDVFAGLHGVDPMAPLRGRYASRFSALRLIRDWGGWLTMADRLAALAGLVAVDEFTPAKAGDLGLARVGGDLALVIGIENGLWAGKGEHGVVAVREVMRAWQRC